MDSQAEWPEWWNWKLELTPHLTKRMTDRQFNEVDLRTMLSDANGFIPEPDGRFVLFTRLSKREWHIVVEPDSEEHVLLVITAFPRD